MTARLDLCVAALLVLSACMVRESPEAASMAPPEEATTAGGEASTMEMNTELELDNLERDSLDLGHDLETALSTDGLDCDGAADLRDRICELAERICEISERHPESPSTGERCERGNQRCQNATSSVSEACD